MPTFKVPAGFILSRDDGTAKHYAKGTHALSAGHADAEHPYFIAMTHELDDDGKPVPRSAPAPDRSLAKAVADAAKATLIEKSEADDDREKATRKAQEARANADAEQRAEAQTLAASMARSASRKSE